MAPKGKNVELTEILEGLENLKGEHRVAELRLKDSMKSLKEEGYDSIEDAEKALKKMLKKLEAKEKAFVKELQGVINDFNERFPEK